MSDNPTHPGRPDKVSASPDFWRISETVIDNDAVTDSGIGLEKFVADKFDLDSAVYVSSQRVDRALKRTRLPETLDELRALIGAAWIDGFAAGQGFEQRGGHQDG